VPHKKREENQHSGVGQELGKENCSLGICVALFFSRLYHYLI